MLDIVEVRPEEKYLKLKCVECSERYGLEAEMEFTFRGDGQGGKKMARFKKIHDHGESAIMQEEDREAQKTLQTENRGF